MDDQGERVSASSTNLLIHRFKIHLDNMKVLAKLSDKYMIAHLHHDICVFISLTTLTLNLDFHQFAHNQ